MEEKKGVLSVQMQMQPSNGIASGTDFTQTRNGVAKCFNLSRGAKALWTEMYSYCYNGSDIFAGIERMSINLGVSKATIMRDTKELVDIGLVTIEHRSFNRTNIYTLYDANDLDIPNGSNTYIKAHPEEFDGYKWLGRKEKVVSPCNHVVAPADLVVAPADLVVAPADLVVAPVLPEEYREEEDIVNNNTECIYVSEKSSIKATPKKQPTLKEVKAAATGLVDHLNATANKTYRNNKRTTNLIKDLLIGDVTLADLILVVDFKVSRWLNDAKMDDFLCPSTLFAEKHFDDYLQEAKLWNEKGRKQSKKGSYLGIQSDDNYGSIVK